MQRSQHVTSPTGNRIRLRDFSRSLPMALLKTRESVMRHFRPAMRDFNLTEQQWRVLRALGSVQEIEANMLARATFLLAPSLTRILRDLEERGHIERRTDPKDQRSALLSLSSQGRALMDDAGTRSEQIYSVMTQRIGAARMEQLMRLLSEVEQELQQLNFEENDASET
jgi:homoprotocatechuate degradation regulator HpaR